jgi:hypothetical protein
MALETFLTALYVIVDDLYQSHIQPQMPVSGGPPAQMSESEVLCLGLAAQWRSGVPWKSERGMLRYVRNHLRYLFPTVLSQSALPTPAPPVGILTHSQSMDPESAHFADQSVLYSNKQWVDLPFCTEDIRAAAIGEPRVVQE